MSEAGNNLSLRILMLVAPPKLANKATKLFGKADVPLHYTLNAMGTASSETMDMLGLGTPDRRILISIMTRRYADRLMCKIRSDLKFGAPGTGVAFTIPITGASNHAIKMLKDLDENNISLPKGKEAIRMSDINRVLIAAIVNQGCSEDVMDAARTAGAGGGTVLHSRSIAGAEVLSLWGLGAQEEKEIVLIAADLESKLDIMSSISEKCGMHSDAKGMVISLPIESAIGLA